MEINRIITTDNNYSGYDLSQQEYEDLSHIANCRIDELTDSDKNELWLFPSRQGRFDDKI